jgi:hypothetical protein
MYKSVSLEGCHARRSASAGRQIGGHDEAAKCGAVSALRVRLRVKGAANSGRRHDRGTAPLGAVRAGATRLVRRGRAGVAPEMAAMTPKRRENAVDRLSVCGPRWTRVLTMVPGPSNRWRNSSTSSGRKRGVRASRLSAAGGTQRRPASGFAARRFGTTPHDSKPLRNTQSRGHFGASSRICSTSHIPKGMHLQAFRNAGGGTRTPDTRIMIPGDLGLATGNSRLLGHAVGHNRTSGSTRFPPVQSPARAPSSVSAAGRTGEQFGPPCDDRAQPIFRLSATWLPWSGATALRKPGTVGSMRAIRLLRVGGPGWGS